jgi:hypothetical protein
VPKNLSGDRPSIKQGNCNTTNISVGAVFKRVEGKLFF